MGQDVVQVQGQLPAAPDDVWRVLGDFCGAWHPWVATIREERGPKGARLRAFTVTGEDTVYRERLTYLSDSDRSLGYTHLDGIRDCQAYDAMVTVTPSGDGGSMVTWSATIKAADARLTAICDGTRAVFEAGIAALARLDAPVPTHLPPAPIVPANALQTLNIGDKPRLAVSVADHPAHSAPMLGGEETDGDRLCLFLHGIGGGRGNWDQQVAVAGRVMPSAALDLRGYGDSDLGPAQSSVDDYCDDILRVAAELGARRLVLVGLSYGSWIATSFAMRHPEMLDGLVLSGGCTGMSEAGPQERDAFRTSREVPLNAGQTPADFAPKVVQVLAGPNASEATRQRLFDSMAAIPVATYRDALVCFTNPTERFDYARLTMPVLMMTGEFDRLAPPAEIRGVATRIHASAPTPDVRFEVIANAGHVCNVEQPASFNRHLQDFLMRLP